MEYQPDDNPVTVHVVAFEDGGVVVSYADSADDGGEVILTKTLILRWDVIEAPEYEEVISTIRDWVDRGLVHIRQARNK